MTKNQKFSNFQSFHAFIVKILTDFVDWNVEVRMYDKNVSKIVS